MYGPRPIRFPAHWCADYSKYRGFLAGGISTASSLLPFFGTRLRRQNFNLVPTQYRQVRRLGFLGCFFLNVSIVVLSTNSNRCLQKAMPSRKECRLQITFSLLY